MGTKSRCCQRLPEVEVVGLMERAIDPGEVIAAVQAPSHGGIASFVGLVRDHHGGRQVVRLEYSAYEAMAEAEMARIVAEAAERWAAKVAVRHRVGSLEVGEVAVAIAASAPHRGAAFEACRYVIEELKRRVPIWKKEHFADGSVAWVDPTSQAGPVTS